MNTEHEEPITGCAHRPRIYVQTAEGKLNTFTLCMFCGEVMGGVVLSSNVTQAYQTDDLVRIANILISESNYAVDVAALNGFCLGAGIKLHSLEAWLRQHLGERFPTELPGNWLYARGL